MNAQSTLAEIVALKECGRHSWEEIGKFFGVPQTTVRSIIRCSGDTVSDMW